MKLGDQMQEMVIDAAARHDRALAPAVKEFEAAYIQMVLNTTPSQLRAAEELGMHRNTLGRKIQELKLDPKMRRKVAERKPPDRRFRENKHKAAA